MSARHILIAGALAVGALAPTLDNEGAAIAAPASACDRSLAGDCCPHPYVGRAPRRHVDYVGTGTGIGLWFYRGRLWGIAASEDSCIRRVHASARAQVRI